MTNTLDSHKHVAQMLQSVQQMCKAKIHYIQHAHGLDLQGRILVKDSVVEHA